jgi:hypothetical protein
MAAHGRSAAGRPFKVAICVLLIRTPLADSAEPAGAFWLLAAGGLRAELELFFAVDCDEPR